MFGIDPKEYERWKNTVIVPSYKDRMVQLKKMIDEADVEVPIYISAVDYDKLSVTVEWGKREDRNVELTKYFNYRIRCNR